MYLFGLQSGAVAQLGERLNGIQKVAGPIPVSSTVFEDSLSGESKDGRKNDLPLAK